MPIITDLGRRVRGAVWNVAQNAVTGVSGVSGCWGRVPGGGVGALVLGRVRGLVWLTSRNTQGSGTKFPSRSSA